MKIQREYKSKRPIKQTENNKMAVVSPLISIITLKVNGFNFKKDT